MCSVRAMMGVLRRKKRKQGSLTNSIVLTDMLMGLWPERARVDVLRWFFRDFPTVEELPFGR